MLKQKLLHIFYIKKLYAKHHEDKKLKMSVLKLEAIKLIKEVQHLVLSRTSETKHELHTDKLIRGFQLHSKICDKIPSQKIFQND